MSRRIDPTQVLTYLNELGYTNITAQQLKEFIIDLGKLIKFDSRFKNDYDDTGYFAESEYCEFSSSNSTTNKENDNKLDKSARKHSTINQQRELINQYIALHIYENKRKKNILHEHCIHTNYKDSMNHNVTSDLTRDKTAESISKSSIKPPSSSVLTKPSSKCKKSKVAFIHPVMSKPSFTKCDPVALYHYYQSEWKKSKIPGEDPRDDLRWAIRERMSKGGLSSKVQITSKEPSLKSSSCR